MLTFKEHLRKYAEKELTLIGFMNSEFGSACLDFLDKCADISGSHPESMKKICEILPRLIDLNPLSPISESDFVPETYEKDGQRLELLRCTRYPYLYRMPDGKYYDDRAIAFRRADGSESDRMYVYQSGNSSKQEVTVPYFPREEIRILKEESSIENKMHFPSMPDYEVE